MIKVYFDEKVEVENTRNGDLQSFTRIYDAYHSYLFRFSLKFLKSPELAEEVVHDVFMKLWENRQGLSSELSLKGYLIKICKNHILNLLKRASREQALLAEITRSVVFEHTDTEDAILAADLEVQVNQIIAQLPVQRQKVFRMYRFDGMNLDEIATQLAISKGTVKDHVLKANRFIRNYLPKSSKTPIDISVLVLAFLI